MKGFSVPFSFKMWYCSGVRQVVVDFWDCDITLFFFLVLVLGM